MTKETKEMYIPFGPEWETEISKLSKSEIIKLLRKAKTGTDDYLLVTIETSREANRMVEGIINDFEAGISTKDETMGLMGNYTGRLMKLFWDNAIKKIKENPEILNT
jgi:hypothetical protein